MADLVTIHVARTLAEAKLLAGRLESEGIPALVPGDLTIGYGVLEVPDTRVQVAPEREDAARELVAAWLAAGDEGA